jgi:hypothetical protein
MNAWLPVILGAAFVWLVYRAGQWNERQSIIHGLEAELALHGKWVGTPYTEDDRGSWDANYMVFKLSTVAVDNAITRGPGLFLNPNLTVTLVSYRQVIGHLNQTIDKATDFQVAAELWRNPAPAEQVAAAKQLVDSVHIVGIGADEGLQQKPAAHAFFTIVNTQLGLDQESRALAVLWVVFGINFSFVKGWPAWLGHHYQMAQHFAAARWRRLRLPASTAEPLGVAPKVVAAPPRVAEPPSASTATASVSHGTAADLKITYLTSTNNWMDQARLPAAKPHSRRKVTTERAAKQPDPKQS